MTRPASPLANLAMVAVFAGLIAAFSLVPAIPMAGGVPITLQTLAVALTGLVLGPWRGFLATLLYLLVGFAGAPVFAGGAAFIGVLTRPSAGYLLSFPIAALLSGALSYALLKRGSHMRAGWLFAAAMTGSLLIIHPAGITGMSLILGRPWIDAALIDLAFWPGDILKNAVAAIIAAAVHRAFPTLAVTNTTGDQL